MRMMKLFRKKRWTDKEVRAWAKTYVKNNYALIDVEYDYGVQDSTVWWCFRNRLSRIDYDLYVEVLNQLSRNKHRSARRKKNLKEKKR